MKKIHISTICLFLVSLYSEAQISTKYEAYYYVSILDIDMSSDNIALKDNAQMMAAIFDGDRLVYKRMNKGALMKGLNENSDYWYDQLQKSLMASSTNGAKYETQEDFAQFIWYRYNHGLYGSPSMNSSVNPYTGQWNFSTSQTRIGTCYLSVDRNAMFLIRTEIEHSRKTEETVYVQVMEDELSKEEYYVLAMELAMLMKISSKNGAPAKIYVY